MKVKGRRKKHTLSGYVHKLEGVSTPVKKKGLSFFVVKNLKNRQKKVPNFPGITEKSR